MRTFAACVSAVAAALALAPAAGASRPPCSRGGETVASSAFVRVYEKGGALRACRKADRRRTVLARAFDDGYVSSAAYGNVAVAGPFVGWSAQTVDVSCKAACPPGYDPARAWVELLDVRSRDSLTAAAQAPTELVVTRAGGLAWIDGGEVRALDASGSRLLDAGAVAGLEPSRTRVSWRNGDVLRVAAVG